MIFSYPILILEKHLDLLGHVNHATYLQLFEEARWDIVTQHGYGLKEVTESKKGPIILEANVRYVKEVLLRENVMIETQFPKWTSLIGEIHQVMKKSDGSIGCEAKFKCGFFDLNQRKLIPAPESFTRLARSE